MKTNINLWMDIEAHSGHDQYQRKVFNHAELQTSESESDSENKDKGSHLMSEMYLTARRQTRRAPQTIPESRGLSQYTRERTWKR